MKTEKSYKYGVTMGNWNAFYEEYGQTPLQLWLGKFKRKVVK